MNNSNDKNIPSMPSLINDLSNFKLENEKEDGEARKRILEVAKQDSCDGETIDGLFYDIKHLSSNENHNQELDLILSNIYSKLKTAQIKKDDEYFFKSISSKNNISDICKCLSATNGICRQKDLRDTMGKTRSNMSNILCDAFNLGLIFIRPAGRENFISLSKKGYAFVRYLNQCDALSWRLDVSVQIRHYSISAGSSLQGKVQSFKHKAFMMPKTEKRATYSI